jgi:Protein of unknown function (DUF2911)
MSCAIPSRRPAPASRPRRALLAAFALLALLGVPRAGHAQAKALTQPPSGDNQKASVTQSIGLVTVRIDYSSPDVHGPDGADRKGKIWGDLVPYGLSDLGFNDCKSCPWRAGANENTVFTVSHDVKIQGQPLAAGSYGLHMLADPAEWTIIFSKNSTSWGSYWYDESEDALRVKVKPVASPYHEWLTYEFTDRKPDRATVALMWEDLAVPFDITVDDVPGLWVASMRKELRDAASFTWVSYEAAAQYCLQNNVNLEEALRWSQKSIDDPFGGSANFTTLTTLAQLQMANGREADAKKTIDRALAQAEVSPSQVHQFARRLQAQGKKPEAMQVFQLNAKKFPGKWPTAMGLARGYSEQGDTRNALTWAKKALAQAPDEPNRKNVENFIRRLESPAPAAAAAK